jgi:hypothetical protein
MPHEVVVAGVVSNIKDSEDVATINVNGTEKSQFNAVVLRRSKRPSRKSTARASTPSGANESRLLARVSYIGSSRRL